MKRFQTVLTLLFIFVFSVSSFAEIEPNNSYQTANTLSPNGSESGSLNEGIPQASYDPDDFFKVTFSSDGAWYVTTTSSSGVEIDLFIIDVNGSTQIASGLRYGTFESVYRVDLKAGTYYVRVYRASGTGTYSLTSRFTSAPYSNDIEANDTYQTALMLSPSAQTTGHIRYYSNGSTDWDDFYKVVIPDDGSLTIDTQSDSADIDVYLIDVNGATQIRSGTAYGLTEHVQFPNLSPGTYYIRLYGAGNKQGAYTLSTVYVETAFNGVTTNDAEKNDSYSTAVSYFNFGITGTSSNYGHLGFYTDSYTDNDDFWVLQTTGDGKVVIRTESNSTLDIDLYLIDVNGSTQISSGSAYGSSETLTFSSLAAGKYYIRAYKASGYGSYQITCEFTAPSLSNDSGSNDGFSSALTINVETKMTGHLGYYSNGVTDYDDYYIFTLPADWDSLYVRTDSESALDIDLYLYNSSQVNINTGYAYGTKEVVKRGSSSAGTYYIRAYRSSGAGGYAIKVSNRYMANPLTDVKEKKDELPVSYS
ncbi:MAG: PPC domain-containing protein, partial [Melioribacteraceae bacterium]